MREFPDVNQIAKCFVRIKSVRVRYQILRGTRGLFWKGKDKRTFLCLQSHHSERDSSFHNFYWSYDRNFRNVSRACMVSLFVTKIETMQFLWWWLGSIYDSVFCKDRAHRTRKSAVRELQSNHIICPNRFPDHLQQVILKTFAVLISWSWEPVSRTCVN